MNDDSTQSGRIEIKDIQHILRLLIEDLYGGDPHLTLRELIQNSHDAIAELPVASSGRNRSISITLSLYDQTPFIEILDNGIGMSEADIKDKLCVVGDSDKLIRAKENPQIIGRFGIGFLSSFIVADHVEVTTRKLGSSQSWLWQTTDVVNWSMKPIAPPFEHGTQVRLYFKQKYPSGVSTRLRSLQTAQGLKEAVQHFAYLLPFPVYVGLAGQPSRDLVNCRAEPWQSDAEAEAAFKVLFSKDLPLYFHRFSVKAAQVRASGVLYFGDQISFNPSVRLYVKRVLVDDQDSRLLPVYAPMISGFVDCPDLDVDLSRRQIRRFDPAYQSLQDLVHSEYQKGFIGFATQSADKFMRLWPNVDKTFIARLLDAYASGGEAVERRAKEFAVAAARYFPFYMVDTVSGGLGRPLWMMIDELIREKARKTNATSQQAGDKITIFYTKTRNPIEKEMLIERYGEVFDVGREENTAHEGLITTLYTFNKEYPDFRLEEVKASQFNPVPEAERAAWSEICKIVEQNVTFAGRELEATAERFTPDQTPIVITDNSIDENAVDHFKNAIQQLGEGVADAQSIARRMTEHLDRLRTRGGIATIHINATNPLVNQLREALQQKATYEVGQLGIVNITWRAVLDYFGWNSTRDMLAHDKRLTREIIGKWLDVTRESTALRDSNQVLRSQLDAAEAMRTNAPGEQSYTDVIVGTVDLQDSTASIISNPAGAPEDAIRVIEKSIAAIRGHLSRFSEPLAFTGDGYQFCVDRNRAGATTKTVRNGLLELPLLLDRAFAEDAELRETITRTMGKVPKVRIALAYGKVLRFWIGDQPAVIGLPAVEATRLCAARALYEAAGKPLLLTEAAYDYGAQWGLWKPSQFTRTESDLEASGLPGRTSIFRPAD